MLLQISSKVALVSDGLPALGIMKFLRFYGGSCRKLFGCTNTEVRGNLLHFATSLPRNVDYLVGVLKSFLLD